MSNDSQWTVKSLDLPPYKCSALQCERRTPEAGTRCAFHTQLWLATRDPATGQRRRDIDRHRDAAAAALVTASAPMPFCYSVTYHRPVAQHPCYYGLNCV